MHGAKPKFPDINDNVLVEKGLYRNRSVPQPLLGILRVEQVYTESGLLLQTQKNFVKLRYIISGMETGEVDVQDYAASFSGRLEPVTPEEVRALLPAFAQDLERELSSE